MTDNKPYSITVSEPWSFESPDGKNIIRGIILSIVNNRVLIFRANYMLDFDGLNGDILILSPRIKNCGFDNIEIDKFEVNGGLFLNEYRNGIEERILKDNCKFVLIGTLNSEN